MIGNWLLRWLPVELWIMVMATTKRNSRILDEMHETARGLHGAGLISKRRMGEFEALCWTSSGSVTTNSSSISPPHNWENIEHHPSAPPRHRHG
ncbi:hypothetical protein [Ectothiorhodospira shaposhnikovii]|uniref:hypothetical protein n=1 Tax=Ectothiorhodospira shaposhnikovii TaxID=1054 RepID=UPI001EE8E1BA|nr:hypothetical protein [Ectothiorhodospira shaposhnikovii]MCG5513797.1 hypothetical protein [Ectothiorhodospira shaposhnikovii]